MTNARNKRLLVVLLALALLAGSVMALGSTFAWEIDKSKEGTPLASTQYFNVSVKYYDGTGYNTSLLTVPPTSGVLWCPGYTKIIYVAITNNEKFIVECSMNLIVSEHSFDDMMQFSVIAKNLKSETASHPANWAEFTQSPNSAQILSEGSHTIFPLTAIAPGDTAYYALAIHMDERATSKYQNLSLDMKFQLTVNSNDAPVSSQE